MDLRRMAKPILLKEQVPTEEVDGARPGQLDGLTIMRYAPVNRERSSGGIDRYLRCLDNGLLQRHRLTILQMCLVNQVGTDQIETEQVGMGRILWIPVPILRTKSRFVDLPKRARYVYDQTLRSRRLEGEEMPEAIFGAMMGVMFQKVRHLPHKYIILSDSLSRRLLSQEVNLLTVHWLTYDAQILMMQAKRAGIPFTLIHHFDNEWFSQPQVRKWLPLAAGIGSVSGKGMPDHVRGRYTNLSDAVDTDFFAPYQASPQDGRGRPTILLPARIDKGKGHKDLLQAARILAARNIDFQVCFAGAVDSEPLHEDLREYTAAAGLGDRVVFLGDLAAQEMRDCYALSSLVVLPSYWEGLGRVLLEAQAMQKPVVAYDSGGVGEAVLPNETGFLVKTGDVEALADGIGSLLTDEAKRYRLGERGRQFVVEKFSLSALIERHETFYLRALRRRNPRYCEGS
jgi:glycosyltransferase involved in cell wall biosynthesis